MCSLSQQLPTAVLCRFHFPAAVSALGMFGTTVASFLACRVFKLVPCKVTITPYFFWTRIMTTGFLIALSFQAGNTAYLYLSGGQYVVC